MTAIILDRPRNEPFVRAIREAGARITLIGDGDIQGSIATAKEDSGVDILFGIGGSPEAVTSACAMAALGGEIQARLWPRDDSERRYAREEGLDLEQVLTTRDLVDSDNTFFAATGVTPGELLDGVRFGSHSVRTNSLVLRSKTGTVRFMDAIHRVEQLRDLSAFEL